MYGYVRPVKGELKVAEFERYQAVYCGLCHELGRRYGPLSQFLVNYDFTFLAMLLAEDVPAGVCRRRCAVHPVRGCACQDGGESLRLAADMTVILGWWKLKDGVRDKSFPGSFGCRLACLALGRAYKKAAARLPDFAGAVEENLRALQTLEDGKCPSIDETADKFACILRAAGEGGADETRHRILGELLYHLGRIIYILDAADDLSEDTQSGAYNPLKYRFTPSDGKLSAEDETTLRTSMQLSHNSICAAYALLGESPYGGILSNIIYLGLPAVTQAVFAGTWRDFGKLHRERSSI